MAKIDIKELKNQVIAELKGLKIKNFLILFIAGIINSIGVTMFLAPVNLYDSGISGTSMLLWQITPEQFTLSFFLALYSIITYAVGIKSVDFIVEGLDKAKSVMIVTEMEDEVCEALSRNFGYGVTQIHATGYYSGKSRSVVYFVVNRFQIAKLKNIVSTIDPGAFITISETSDVLGSSLKGKN